MHEGHTHEHAAPEPKLLLRYMLDHNRQHAEELAGLAAKLEGAGGPQAAALTREALAAYEQGNAKLAEALSAL